MTNLFSNKQVAGICFLLIMLTVYLSTGFDFATSISMPSLPNPFGNNQDMPKVQPVNKDDSNADVRRILDNVQCSGLYKFSDANPPDWNMRPYLNQKMMERGC